MQFVHRDEIPESEVEARFGHSPGPNALVALALVLPLAVGLFLLAPTASEWSWVIWATAGPFIALVGSLLFIAAASSFGAARAALLPSNWVMKVGSEGVWLQLRSYLNHHFDGDDPTVLFLRYDEIESASRSNEWFESYQGGEKTLVRRSFLELHVPRLDAEALRSTIAAERARRGPERSFLGITSRQRYDHVPVLVGEPSEPQCVRVDWRGGDMLAALEGRVTIGEERKIRANGDDPSTRLRALVQRGEKISAIALCREELGLELVDAKRYVDELTNRAA